jgi:hypothetical protein
MSCLMIYYFLFSVIQSIEWVRYKKRKFVLVYCSRGAKVKIEQPVLLMVGLLS